MLSIMMMDQVFSAYYANTAANHAQILLNVRLVLIQNLDYSTQVLDIALVRSDIMIMDFLNNFV